MVDITQNQLFQNIRQILNEARQGVARSINSAMVQAYWQIGRLIVEDEQNGRARAKYGEQQLEQLSQLLKIEYGKGFDITNLRNMRKFYLVFPIQDAVRLELSWTHYRKIIHIENAKARSWYIAECIANNWSARALERQVGNLYYERLLSSNDKLPVIKEAGEKTAPLQNDIRDYIRDPYILDFLNLSSSALENTVEQALIDNLQKFLLELGRGFAFVSRQQRISVESQDFYLDLVFYNYKLKCF